MMFAVGVKMFPSPGFGVRAGLQWVPTYIKSDADGYRCDPMVRLLRRWRRDKVLESVGPECRSHRQALAVSRSVPRSSFCSDGDLLASCLARS